MRKAKKTSSILFALLVLCFVMAPASGQEEITNPTNNYWARSTLTGDWGGARTWLEDHGLKIMPRLSQFYQVLDDTSADDDGDSYGGKADVLVHADLYKFGFWPGLSLTTHAEYNFGWSLNGRGGTILPVNTALQFPGIEGPNRFDVSSLYLTQKFGDSVSLIVGKINMIEASADRPFMGGAGIDRFWDIAFTAPPTGTVPPYLLGALMDVRTEAATFKLWVYDPNSVVNRSGLENAFETGVTLRGTVEIPVMVGDLSGHQGFFVTYSTKPGPEPGTLGSIILPRLGRTVSTKDERYHYGYYLNQYLYQSKEDPDEGLGLFGQIGFSDRNPNKLDWQILVGLGGTGLIPGRSRDKWGVGYYHYSLSSFFKSAFRRRTLRDENGWEIFYNASITPWLTITANLQIIEPGRESGRAVFFGLRPVIRF